MNRIMSFYDSVKMLGVADWYRLTPAFEGVVRDERGLSFLDVGFVPGVRKRGPVL